LSLPGKFEIEIDKYSGGSIIPEMMPVSTEYPVTLIIGDRPYATIACSGSDLESYAAGHLVTEGIIRSMDEIREIRVDREKLTVHIIPAEKSEVVNGLTTIKNISAAGGGSKKSLPNEGMIRKSLPDISAAVVIRCMEEFLTLTKERSLTHGVHSAALYSTGGEKVVFFDEIGRHNAIDKVIGYSLMNNISLEDKMVFSTGRVSSEIAFKFINASAPVLVTKASPTSFSVELARKYNFMILCRVREGSFWIVNGSENIII